MTYTFEQLKEDVRKEAEALRERNKRPKTYSYMIGEVFGRLTVMSIYRDGKVAYAKCKCVCGNEHSVKIRSLTEGGSTSCGCYRLERVRKALVKYDYDSKFFVSNTPEMFYVVGLMYTDGNLSYDRPRFRLGFQADDKYMLERVALLIKRSKKLERNKTNGAYEFSGTDQTIYNQLLSFGITPRKSLTIEVRKDLISNTHFWRGVIDGNGWITISGGITLGLCGTMNTCQSFLEFAANYCDVSKKHPFERSANWGQITINGVKSLKVLEAIYKDKGELFLTRKYNKYIAFLRGETDNLEL
jgi:hypothetical protein